VAARSDKFLLISGTDVWKIYNFVLLAHNLFDDDWCNLSMPNISDNASGIVFTRSLNLGRKETNLPKLSHDCQCDNHDLVL